MGVSGKPVPSRKVPSTVHSFSRRPRQPLISVPPPRPSPLVYCAVRVEQLALIKCGERALRAQIEPVLRNSSGRGGGRSSSSVLTLRTRRHVALPAEHRIVINRFRVGIFEVRGKTIAQPAAQLKLRFLPRGVATRGAVHEIRWTGRTWIGCADRIGIGQKLLRAVRALHADIGGHDLERSRQIPLHGKSQVCA